MGATHTWPIVVNVHARNLRQRADLGPHSSFAQWAAQPGHLYIGRNMSFYVPGTVASKWANPFTLRRGLTRVEALALYEQHIRNTPALWNALSELAQMTELGCWCRENPDGQPRADGADACHGDVLIRLMRERMAAQP